MNNAKHKIWNWLTISVLTFPLFVFIASCEQDDIMPEPHTAGRHLRFSGSTDNDKAATRASWEDHNYGHLIFSWDYSTPAATESELKMAFVRDGLWLASEGNKFVTDVKILEHTDPAKAGDKHWAEFETIETYNPEIGENAYDGHRIYAVTPINDANASTMKIDMSSGELIVTLSMPTVFHQLGRNNLAHLGNYMYMYDQGIIADGTALLTFNHLAAYVRFKVYNWRGEPATIYGVKMEAIDADGNADTASGVQANYSDDDFVYTPATAGQGVQVNIIDGSIATDEKAFIYAPVFPVGSENSFEGKTLRFTIIAQDPTSATEQGKYEYFTYELKGEIFKNVTDSYDWIPGDLYTFHLYLDDVLRVPEVTVNDWIETDIDCGVAEEYFSNIVDATTMNADELNAAVATALEAGETDLTITLIPNAPAEMITAIRRAICDTESIADGSINLTLKGVTTIPGTTNMDAVAFGGGDIYDEAGEVLYTEYVTRLASINLPNVTEIGDQAFYHCKNLASITAPNVKYIGERGLQGTAITSIDMPLLKEAGSLVFAGLVLTEVYLPSLETAGAIAFGLCDQLHTVDLPKLQTLSQQIFSHCTSLVSVNVPVATSMGNNVFDRCSELVSITLPGVTELSSGAFARCTKLENITLGSVITNVNENLFDGEALSTNITLTLHPDQATAETLPASVGTEVEWAGFTWKEVKFVATE